MTSNSNPDIDFGRLEGDANLVNKTTSFHEAVDNISKTLRLASDRPEFYEKLSNVEKLKYNLLMSYGLNTLFWMYLRLEGEDPTKHEIKNENERLKQHMARAKQIQDRNTIMPRVNVDVARRFVRSGLWDPNNPQQGPPAKKTKFNS